MNGRALAFLIGLGSSGVLFGCAGAPRGVGLTGPAQDRTTVVAVAQDLTAVTLRKGRLQTNHDMIASDHCGGDCKYRQRGHSRLQLDIAKNGVVSVANEGVALEEFDSIAGGTQQQTEWSRTWAGSWTHAEGRMVLDLAPGTTSCQRKDANGATDVAPDCGELALQLVCKTTNLMLHTPKNRRERVWVCRPKGRVAAKTGMTPFPWVFGIDAQVDMSDRSNAGATERFYLQEVEAKKPASG
jgi:hypothetical protein